MQREERKEQKPWRQNMRSTESQEKEFENEKKKDATDKKEASDLDPLEKFHRLTSFKSKEEDPIVNNENEVKKDDEKPWRQNMKKSVSKECK